MSSRIIAVAVLALAGLFVAAGVTFAASRLVSQPIGLSYQQRSLDDSLAPTKTITVTRTTTTIGSAATTTSTSGSTAPSAATVNGDAASGGSAAGSAAAPAAPNSQSDVGSAENNSSSTVQQTASDRHSDGDGDD